MKLQWIAIALASLFFGHTVAMGQGGPTLTDYVNPKGWPNPVYDFQSNWLDPYFPPTVLQGQTIWVATRQTLQLKHKDYYVFFDHEKQNGSANGGWVSNTEHMAYLQWEDPNFPGEPLYYPDPAEIYEAIPFSQYDPRCFLEFNGPYCQIKDTPSFLGKVGGFWVAFSGMGRRMGGAFTLQQISKIQNANKGRNGGNLKSDCRSSLVNEFPALHPEISPTAIPVDPYSGNLSTNPNMGSYAEVCHILPPVAPQGNGCGRNAYRNALIVSNDLKQVIASSGMPSDSFILYCEFLATKYNKTLPAPLPAQTITYKQISDPREVARLDSEYLDEEETRGLIDYIDERSRLGTSK